MKKKLLTYIILTAFIFIKAQIPIPYVHHSNGNIIISNNSYVEANTHYIGQTTYDVPGPVQFDVIASDEIHVQPEFHAYPSGTGYTHLYIDPNIVEVASFHPNGFTNIPQYDRFELGIKLPASVQAQVNTFLTTYSGPKQGLNPYDPDDIKVECVVYDNPSYIRNGFYYQPYSVSNNIWVEGTTDYPFRIRIAPAQGNFCVCDINVYISGQLTFYCKQILFTIAGSNNSNPGNLIMAAPNLQKMQFQDGSVTKPFFGMGQNFPDGDVVVCPTPSPGVISPNPNFTYTSLDLHACKSSPQTNIDQRNYIKDLASKSGNLIRLRLDPWGYPLEYMDYRSLVPTQHRYSLERCLTNYQHNQMFLWELDKVLEVCEDPQNRVYLMLSIFNDGLSHKDGVGGLARWQDFPYAALLQDLGGSNASIKSFFNDAVPKSYFKKQLYYINARWGYSTSIAMWEFINESENIEGYQAASVSTNSVDPLLPGAIKDWVCEMSDYMHSFSPRHLTTNGTTNTSTSPGPINNLFLPSSSPCLDIFSNNAYTNEVDNAGAGFPMDHYNWKDMLHSGGADWFNNKQIPFIYGEIGLGVACVNWNNANNPNDHSSYNNTPWTDAEVYNDRSFHNNLWATTVSGNVATGLNWNDCSQLHVDHRNNFRSLSKFVNQVKWTNELVPQRYQNPPINEITGDDPNHPLPIHHILDNLYMKDASSDYVVGWSMINTSFWAYDQNYSSFPNYQNLLTCVNYDPAKIIDYDISNDPNDAAIEIRSMTQNNHWYRAEIFDTYNVNTNSFSFPVQSDGSGTVRFHMPFFNHDGGSLHNMTADRAYIIHDDAEEYWPGNTDRNKENENQPESNKAIQYASDFDRGDSHGRLASPGLVEVIKWKNGATSREKISDSKISDFETQRINVFPNPANSFITLDYNEAYFTDAEITVSDLAGKMIRKVSNSKTVEIRDLDQGLYLVTFRSGQFEKTFKISVAR